MHRCLGERVSLGASGTKYPLRQLRGGAIGVDGGASCPTVIADRSEEVASGGVSGGDAAQMMSDVTASVAVRDAFRAIK